MSECAAMTDQHILALLDRIATRIAELQNTKRSAPKTKKMGRSSSEWFEMLSFAHNEVGPLDLLALADADDRTLNEECLGVAMNLNRVDRSYIGTWRPRFARHVSPDNIKRVTTRGGGDSGQNSYLHDVQYTVISSAHGTIYDGIDPGEAFEQAERAARKKLTGWDKQLLLESCPTHVQLGVVTINVTPARHVEAE
jgi:hypothetical protein